MNNLWDFYFFSFTSFTQILPKSIKQNRENDSANLLIIFDILLNFVDF